MDRRRVYRRLRASLIGVAAAAVIAPAGAGAATTVGSTFDPSGSSCSANNLFLQSFSASDLYAAPSAGVLTSWSFQASNQVPPNVKLVVARATANPDEFFIVAHSAVETPVAATTNTYTDISIPVQAGDFLGMRTSSFGDCGNLAGGAGYVSRYSSADPAPNTTFGFPALATDDIRLDISATLEADLDGDGLGDETEDSDDDNDTVADEFDNCPILAASTASGCPAVSRSLTLSYSKSKRAFKGALGASEPSCVGNHRVTVWKRAGGADKKIGVDEVNAQGKYLVSKRGRPGRYYSGVNERVVPGVAACDSATSPKLRLR
jgi:hypothetical protein